MLRFDIIQNHSQNNQDCRMPKYIKSICCRPLSCVVTRTESLFSLHHTCAQLSVRLVAAHFIYSSTNLFILAFCMPSPSFHTREKLSTYGCVCDVRAYVIESSRKKCCKTFTFNRDAKSMMC